MALGSLHPAVIADGHGRWRVQVGFKKGKYTTKYDFRATQSVKAQLWYLSVLTHSGHKKRLVDPNGNIVLRETT